MHTSNIPPQPEPSRASGYTADVRTLRAVTMSEIELQAHRRVLADGMSASLRQQGAPHLGYYTTRWWLSFGVAPKLTGGDALRLAGELRWEAEHTTGDERRERLKLTRRWLARLR